MVKMLMRFDGSSYVSRQMSHATPQQTTPQQTTPQQTTPTVQATASLEQRRKEGRHTAIRKMMNVYEPKRGGGCGSCGGAK